MWVRVLLCSLFMLCVSQLGLWSQSPSLPTSSPVVGISYENWLNLNAYVERLSKLNASQGNEVTSLKQNSKKLLEQLTTLRVQLQASLITNEGLRAELEKVRLSLEALEASSKGLQQGILRLQTERDIAIGGCVVLGVAAIAATIWALSR